MKLRHTLLISTLLGVNVIAQGQRSAPLWEEFANARSKAAAATLPDFSYAGYHFSEKPLPDVKARKHFTVTNYGAQPSDNQYDDVGIQAAIRAAEKNPGGGVVFFPPGKYLISPNEDKSKYIRISASNIVLKGSGRGPGGTEIFQDKMRPNTRQFQFKPEIRESRKLTTITQAVPREHYWVEVANTSDLKVGQNVVIRHQSEAFTRLYFDPLPLDTEWTRLFGPQGGMNIFEIHTIEKIEGDRIKFKNPVHFDLKPVEGIPFDLYTYESIRECGVEDILFTSNWKNYPEEFVHHKNGIHDYAWEAIGMEFVEDSWVRNCEFRDWNEAIFMRSAYKVTVINNSFTGKKGHSSVHARTGYGVLIKNCQFNGSHHHGPGTGYSAVNTVITQCTMGVDQNIDSHSGQPMVTLFDQVQGGVFSNLGGPMPGLPHHGKHLVLWNFQHRSTKDFHYNFWDIEKRRNHTIAHPILVGFQSDTKVTFENEGINQLPGVSVEPISLFEAQLRVRLNDQSHSSAAPNGLPGAEAQH